MEFDLNLIKNESSDDKSDNPGKIEEKKLKEKQARQIRNVRKWFNGIVSGEISENPNAKYFRRSDRPWTIKERQQRYKERQKDYPIKEEQLLTKRSSAAERQRQYRIRRKMKLEKIREILHFNGSNRLPDVDAELVQNVMEQDDDKNCNSSSQAVNQKRYRQKIKLLLQQYEHLISEDSSVKEKSALTAKERQKRYQQRRKFMHDISNDSKKIILQQDDIVKFNLTRNDLERLSSRQKIVKLIPKEDICKLLKTKSLDNFNKIQSQISPTEKKIIKLIPKDEIHNYIVLDNKLIKNSNVQENLQENSKIATIDSINHMNSHLIDEDLKSTCLNSNIHNFENVLKDSTLPNSSESIKILDLEEPSCSLETKICKNKSGENQRNYRQRLKNKLELERLANNTVREEIIKQLQRERQRRYRERKKQAALLSQSTNNTTANSEELALQNNTQFKENCQKLSRTKKDFESSNKILDELLNIKFEIKNDVSPRIEGNTSKAAEYMRTYRQRKKAENNKHKRMLKDESETDNNNIKNIEEQNCNKNFPMSAAERMRKYRLRKKLKKDFSTSNNSNCKKLVDEPQVSLQNFGKFNLKYEDGSTVVFDYKPEEFEQSTIETDPLQIEGICTS